MNKKRNIVLRKVDKYNHNSIEKILLDINTLIGNRKRLFITNLMSGIARGVGIGIGVTLITAIIISFLQKIVTLNIPVIGEYISDIVQIVQKSRTY